MRTFCLKRLVVSGMIVAGLAVRLVTAQQPVAAPQPPVAAPQPPPASPVVAPRPTSAAPTPAKAAARGSDADEKAALLASPAWKQVTAEYQKWLASQAIYTAADVKRINARLAAEIQAMSAGDLQEYLDDWQAKLKVLNGQDFQEAQQWLAYYLQPCTDGYRAKTLKKLGLTDVPQMSATQLENAILRIRADRLAIEQSQAAFEQSRQQQVQAVQQAQAATRQSLQQAGEGSSYGTGPGFNTFQSPYRPPKYNPPPLPHMQFYVNSYGQVGYALPF